MPPNTTFSTENYARNRKNLSILTLISFIAVILLAIILTIINFQKSATLDIIVAPTKAIVKIDGREFKTNETIKYYPGNYTAEISADGFIPQSLSLDLIAGQESQLYVALEPTPENSNYYDQHPDESGRRQAVYDATYQLNSSQYTAQYPIIQILPYQNSNDRRGYDFTTYRIDYGQYDNCNSAFCIKITDNVGIYHDEAMNYLKNSGQDTSNYEILYEYTGTAEAKNLIPKYPIVKDLPIQVALFNDDYSTLIQYTINYTFENDNFNLIVNDESGNSHGIALEKLKNLGYNPDDYHIIYNNISSEYKSYPAPNDYDA